MNDKENNNIAVNKCKKCNGILLATDKFCPTCGTAVGDNSSISETKKEKITFDPMYLLSEDKMVEEFIKKEIAKSGIESSSSLIPSDILKRRKIFNIIFSILLFVYISIIFFHYPLYTYIIGFIILLIFFIATRRYNLLKFLKKQVKSRPQEKISNIVMSTKNSFVQNNSKSSLLISLSVAVILPLILFINPRIIYEKVDGGYAVRYYIYGLTNYKTVNIPNTYKNEKIVSLRGNTFSNMFFLESVSLPDSILEIRGQAFKNCLSLNEVTLPKNLQYLGGGAFYNAGRLKSITLPDTLTYLGGEAFYNASSLTNIKLSDNLTEIRGNTFENCILLEKIDIPDNITRIGAHAFYGDYNLSRVNISPNSKLTEIGSSAFRGCDNLYEIYVPENTIINIRAFKESPTRVIKYNSTQNEENSINEYNY